MVCVCGGGGGGYLLHEPELSPYRFLSVQLMFQNGRLLSFVCCSCVKEQISYNVLSIKDKCQCTVSMAPSVNMTRGFKVLGKYQCTFLQLCL